MWISFLKNCGGLHPPATTPSSLTSFARCNHLYLIPPPPNSNSWIRPLIHVDVNRINPTFSETPTHLLFNPSFSVEFLLICINTYKRNTLKIRKKLKDKWFIEIRLDACDICSCVFPTHFLMRRVYRRYHKREVPLLHA